MALLSRRQLCEGVVIANEFADDIILFGQATEGNVRAVKGIMRAFELVSGLKVNYGKSMLVGINVCDEWLSKIACILNCKVGEIPFKYFGVPVEGSNYKLDGKLEQWHLVLDIRLGKGLTIERGREGARVRGTVVVINNHTRESRHMGLETWQGWQMLNKNGVCDPQTIRNDG
ncbi:hypothetical protein SLEP1_g4711 [Rubroshorea leprosula]|uniref:Reverse transcriptase domain-containing protein n=1 Tax=Rubroshorea leprosula TaxID=152421 RepID=A0AAV5I0C7_9ROSI|nr:hypothetical protein SLEP1_g4711 [Rubroshorea leprosula]